MYETLVFIGSVIYFNQILLRCRDRLPAIQLGRFRKLLAHAQKHSPYLREKYRGLDPRNVVPADVPPITKAEMMEHFDGIVTDRRITRRAVEAFTADPANVGTLFLGRYPVLHTSGSQGQPGLFVQDRWSFVRLFAMQAARGHTLPKTWKSFFTNFLKKQKLAIFQLRPGFFPSGAAFAYMPKAMQRFAQVLRLQYTDPMAENVRKLNEFKPNIVSGYGHVMTNLARAELAGDLQLRASGELKLMTSIAEPVLDETRDRIKDVFGIHLATHYAMGECLALSMGCPYHPGAHLNIDLAMLEVVDARGAPVPDGQPGSKVRVTNLTNYVQPIIRYEIDDVVTMNVGPCPCGNVLPLIRNIAGRFNDALWIQRGGELQQLPTFFFTVAFHPLLDLAEFQVNQVARNRFEVRAIGLPGRGLEPRHILDALTRQARAEGLHDILEFDVRMVDAIPPDPRTGKLRRYVSHLPTEAPASPPAAAANQAELVAAH